ncbi:hypothetical protein LCGC14_0481450 [marine sediment metagenome]|uniref:PD-(D/E)XK endonuclease-like domain-containing protein n=1 Tax=marine sediment metagenome TaxID=412755 RepID=A0A0F9S950_9ZZZZ
MPDRVAIIRTSDRQLFKRCRRKWGWGSGLRQNLKIKDSPSYFWIGSGGHFALEDYHGYNHYQHPVEAFRAYVTACRALKSKVGFGLPDDWEEQTTLAEGILEYYLIWASERDTYKTVWIDGKPQVEVKCQIDLTPYISRLLLIDSGYDKVIYQLTLDRLVEIEGEYWIQDWKFYKSFAQGALEYDQQMSAYIWGAATIFEKPIAGAILHEFLKKLANPPRVLGTGKISTAEKQGTTHRLYREALIEVYGNVQKATHKHLERLNDLAARETEDRDDFIKRAKTRRTPLQQQAEGTKILMEVEDMINPNLPLYTNATRDCNWDCNLQDICLMIDRNDDWAHQLNDITAQRDEEFDQWRQHLPT